MIPVIENKLFSSQATLYYPITKGNIKISEDSDF